MAFGTLFVISIVAGLVGAMSGMGGGVILIPALALVGIDIKQAIAISNLSTITVSISATATYARRHMPNLHVSALLQVFAVVGAWIGAFITIASGRRLLFFVSGVLLSSCWWWVRRRGPPGERSAASQDAVSRWFDLEGIYYDEAERRSIGYAATRAALACPLMFGAGIISGSLGIGASGLTVLIQEAVMGLPTKVSVSTSQLIIASMALVGTNVYLEGGLIHSSLVAPVALGVPLGAFIGSKLLVGLTNRAARLIFIAAFMILGVQMILHGLHVTP